MSQAVDRVYLVRHGRTVLNADGRLRGLSDPPLDEVGKAEVARLAEVLAAKHPKVSPLRRAVATAEAIARAANISVVVDARLNDRDYGPSTGAVKAEVEQQFGSVDAAPGVEPADAVEARASAGFHDLVGQFDSGPLILVSHDAINRALLVHVDRRLVGAGPPHSLLGSTQPRRRHVARRPLRPEAGVAGDAFVPADSF